eukprot:2158925-Rhodomonas_salina.2
MEDHHQCKAATHHGPLARQTMPGRVTVTGERDKRRWSGARFLPSRTDRGGVCRAKVSSNGRNTRTGMPCPRSTRWWWGGERGGSSALVFKDGGGLPPAL